MKITYDPRHNIAYLRLADSPEEVETLHVSDELNVDLSPTGKIYGFELLNANEQLRTLIGTLTVENEATGVSIEVALP
jgi:uncharacterized protein YuzE